MIQALYQVTLVFEHIPGRLNTLADALIRTHHMKQPDSYVADLVQSLALTSVDPCLHALHLVQPILSMDAALDRQDAARADGTNRHCHSAVRAFLIFCHRYNWHPLRLTHQQICVYIEFLNQKPLAPPPPICQEPHWTCDSLPAACGRTASGEPRSWAHRQWRTTLVGAPPVANHARVTRALKATMRRKNYKKEDRPPTGSCHYIGSPGRPPPNQRTHVSMSSNSNDVLRGFSTGRGCPVNSCPIQPIEQPHQGRCHPRHGLTDCECEGGIKPTAVQSAPPDYSVQGTRPLISAASPTACPDQPMFVYKGSQRHITPSYVRAQWTAALTKVGAPHKQFTLHTLRKAEVSTLGSRQPLATLAFARTNSMWRRQMTYRFATLRIPFCGFFPVK